MTEQECGGGAAQEPSPGLRAQGVAPRGRHDGITKLTGFVKFTTSSATMDVNVEGSVSGTDTFKAEAAQGDTVPKTATRHNAQKKSSTRQNKEVWSVEASSLPRADAAKDYTVRVSYDLTVTDTNNQQRTTTKWLEGTAKKPLTIPTPSTGNGSSGTAISLLPIAPPPSDT